MSLDEYSQIVEHIYVNVDKKHRGDVTLLLHDIESLNARANFVKMFRTHLDSGAHPYDALVEFVQRIK